MMESTREALPSTNIEIPPSSTVEDDGETLSIYVRTIKRIIQRTRSTPPTTRLAFTNRRRRKSSTSNEDIELAEIHDDQNSITEAAANTTYNPYFDRLAGRHQYETKSLYSASNLSVPIYEYGANNINHYDMTASSTDNIPFEFMLPSADESRRKPPVYARRYFARVSDSGIDGYTDTCVQEHQSHHSGGELSDSSEPDINTKWSWRNLKREFKLSHSETLFHLYQAKLQHSFFVALLILNIIFNLGAIISYLFSNFHDMYLCK